MNKWCSSVFFFVFAGPRPASSSSCIPTGRPPRSSALPPTFFLSIHAPQTPLRSLSRHHIPLLLPLLGTLQFSFRTLLRHFCPTHIVTYDSHILQPKHTKLGVSRAFYHFHPPTVSHLNHPHFRDYMLVASVVYIVKHVRPMSQCLAASGEVLILKTIIWTGHFNPELLPKRAFRYSLEPLYPNSLAFGSYIAFTE